MWSIRRHCWDPFSACSFALPSPLEPQWLPHSFFTCVKHSPVPEVLLSRLPQNSPVQITDPHTCLYLSPHPYKMHLSLPISSLSLPYFVLCGEHSVFHTRVQEVVAFTSATLETKLDSAPTNICEQVLMIVHHCVPGL